MVKLLPWSRLQPMGAPDDFDAIAVLTLAMDWTCSPLVVSVESE